MSHTTLAIPGNTTLETCDVCVYAAEHGCWPRDHRGTHCRICHLSWAGRAQAHCTVCHQLFSTDGVAGYHWTKAGHVHPAEVLDSHEEPRFRQDERGVWRSADRARMVPVWAGLGAQNRPRRSQSAEEPFQELSAAAPEVSE